MPTIALLPGDHTGGSVDLVDIKAGTPGSSRPSVKNHLALMKNTAQGVEEVGKSLRLHDLEQAEGHVVPEEDGTRYDLETRFSPVDEQRELLVRQRDDGDTTKVWSNTWPDNVEVSVFKPDEADTATGEAFRALDLVFEAGGGGGELPTVTRTDPATGTVYEDRVWTFNGVAPVGDTHFDWSYTIPENKTGHMKWDILGQRFMKQGLERLKGFAGATVDAGDALLSSIQSTASSLEGDFKSKMGLDPVDDTNCHFEGDLDGVQEWSNQTVAHGDCTGEVQLHHQSEDYNLKWESGTADASGSLDDVSVQFKNDSYREGDSTKRTVTVDTTGELDYEDPSLKYRDEDREYTVPECMLTGEC
jgi:hypothetical protein